MRNVDEQIKISNETICNLIDKFEKHERGLLSQTILGQLRNLVEAVYIKVVGETVFSYENFKRAKKCISSRADLKFLYEFHGLLQLSKSHYATDEDASERLMLHYLEFLFKIKKLLRDEFDTNILNNIEKFPTNTDQELSKFYEKIARKIKDNPDNRVGESESYSYYVQKIKPFFVKQEIFYEVTLSIAKDRISKFDRFITFTKLEIEKNYSIKCSIYKDFIDVSRRNMPIYVIDNWETSIRPCELTNFAKIFNTNVQKFGRTNEYNELMSFLTSKRRSLVEIIDFSENDYNEFKEIISKKSKKNRITTLLDNCRHIIGTSSPGSNLLRYLLHNLNNLIIKNQLDSRTNYELSKLNLNYACIPFDEMPFATSPVKHNPTFFDLFKCLDVTNRDHELLARRIKNNTENKGWLYTSLADLEQFNDIPSLINKFNSNLYEGGTQPERKMGIYKDHVFITGYENAVVEIIRKLKELSKTGIKNYSNSVKAWLSSQSDIDDLLKKSALINMFANSKVSLIYGAAGTGKTRLIEYISSYNNAVSKLYLATTHSAINNLRNRIQAQNAEFKTISSFLDPRTINPACDVLIIDECSVVSNLEMRDILRKANFGALILVGDVVQIESIRFGNWFYLAKKLISETGKIELKKSFRTKEENLLLLWKKVRELQPNIIEHITENKFSTRLDDSIFKNSEKDEIILCLNYDGPYGINNINRFLQESNKSEPVFWGVHTYKVGDPILFNETNRYLPVIHNNLKGTIRDIKSVKESIQFDIEIDKPITELEIRSFSDLELLTSNSKSKSVVRFCINNQINTDEDDDNSETSDVVPFNVAYAVSIHKAQGLEYDSVKVVITNESEEKISHNIFYTAITRAKKELKIYCTPESEKIIINKLKEKFNHKDSNLLINKYGL